MLQLDINYSQLDDVIKKLEADNKQVEKAMRRALSKTSYWMKSQSAKKIAKILDLPQKEAKRRIFNRIKNNNGNISITVWYGLNPVAYSRLNPVQQREGVKAGKHFVKKAFVRSFKSGKKNVFRREGKDRLPVDVQTLPIEKESNIVLSGAIFKGIEPYFTKRFEEELKWATR